MATGVAGGGAVVADVCTSSVVVVGFGMAVATGSEHSAAAATVAAVGVSTSVVVVEIWIAVAPGKQDSFVAAAADAAAAAASVDTGFARVQNTARWDILLGKLDIEVVGLQQQCPDEFFYADMTSS
jgi:hypothetical protein